MKTTQTQNAHPFAFMMDPAAVLAAVEGSEHLKGLKRRVYHPLDKPLIPVAGSESDAYDRELDAAPLTSFGDTLYGQQ
ncbi:MAG: hypothetical protein RL722_2631 [Pseudomonadota bacterium]|jgi:hypothetical protein